MNNLFALRTSAYAPLEKESLTSSRALTPALWLVPIRGASPEVADISI